MRVGLFLALILSCLFFRIEAASAHAWATATVDDTLEVGYEAVGAALDSEGRQAACYRDETQGVLKYAENDGDGWNTETVDDGEQGRDDTGWYCALVFDAGDLPHIVYLNPTRNALRHAVKRGGIWRKSDIDADVLMDFSSASRLDAALSPDGILGVAYYEARLRELRYAEYDGAAWQVEAVPAGAGNVGRAPSLDYDSDGNPGIAFAKRIDDARSDLLYTRLNGGAWTEPEIIDAGGYSGLYISMKYDANDVPHVAYHHIDGDSLQHLKYVNRNGVAWGEAIVLDSAVARGAAAGLYCEMVLGPDGNAHILFRHDFVSALFGRWHELKLASLYFVDRGDDDLVVTSVENINVNVWNDYAGLNLALRDDELFLAWTTGNWRNGYVLNASTLANWQPVIRLLTPDAGRDSVTQGDDFTVSWIDFDPDGDAAVRFSYRNDDFEMVRLGDPVAANGADNAAIATGALPPDSYPLFADISDDAFVTYSGSIAPRELTVTARPAAPAQAPQAAAQAAPAQAQAPAEADAQDQNAQAQPGDVQNAAPQNDAAEPSSGQNDDANADDEADDLQNAGPDSENDNAADENAAGADPEDGNAAADTDTQDPEDNAGGDSADSQALEGDAVTGALPVPAGCSLSAGEGTANPASFLLALGLMLPLANARMRVRAKRR